MAIFKGHHYTATFTLEDDAGAAIDITGFTFEADFRQNIDDEEPAFTLTTGDGFTTLDAPAGRLQMDITAARTEMLELGRVLFDVTHANASPGPDWMFRCSVKVKQSVTRDE